MGRNNRALISGLFLIVLLTATVSLFYWLGHLKQDRYGYVVTTQATVSGLNPESTVFFRGIAVGKVLDIHFDPEHTDIILITIEVDKEIVFTKGVYATLQYKGVTGLTQLELKDAGGISEKLLPGTDVANRIPLMPSITDKLLNSGDDLLKKADHLMIRLNSLLNEENEKNIVGILANLKTLSEKLSSLEKSVDNALKGIPALTTDARKTLKNLDELSLELKTLSKEAKSLSNKVGSVSETGIKVGNSLMDTTLPKINRLLLELQTATQNVGHLSKTLENNPQSLLLGNKPLTPGPGEPGYKEPQ